MTIRLLRPFNGYPTNAIVAFPGSTEAALLRDPSQATSDLTGGFVWLPNQPNSAAPLPAYRTPGQGVYSSSYQPSTVETAVNEAGFLQLYSALGTVEAVIRELTSSNCRGIVSMPAGTFDMGRPGSIETMRGLDMRDFQLRGVVGSTIFNWNSSLVWDSLIRLGGVTINNTGSCHEFRSCDFNNEWEDTPIAVTFSKPVLWTRQSVFNTESCTYLAGVFLNYASTGSVDGCVMNIADVSAVSSLVDFPSPCGLAASQASRVTFHPATGSYRVNNPSALAAAVAVSSTNGSVVDANGGRIGQTAQTIATGISVSGFGVVDARGLVFQGTVTTQFSKTVNVVDTAGIICS